MIEITPALKIDESEIQCDFIRASGPGGQNVNKVASAVQLRFNVRQSPSLPAEVKERLLRLAGSRATEDGTLILEGRRYRTQEQNRLDALERLRELLKSAAQKPKTRLSTRPTRTAKARRLAQKKRRGQVKKLRRYSPEDGE